MRFDTYCWKAYTTCTTFVPSFNILWRKDNVILFIYLTNLRSKVSPYMYWSLHWVSSVGGVDMLNFNNALFLEAIYRKLETWHNGCMWWRLSKDVYILNSSCKGQNSLWAIINEQFRIFAEKAFVQPLVKLWQFYLLCLSSFTSEFSSLGFWFQSEGHVNGWPHIYSMQKYSRGFKLLQLALEKTITGTVRFVKLFSTLVPCLFVVNGMLSVFMLLKNSFTLLMLHPYFYQQNKTKQKLSSPKNFSKSLWWTTIIRKECNIKVFDELVKQWCITFGIVCWWCGCGHWCWVVKTVIVAFF